MRMCRICLIVEEGLEQNLASFYDDEGCQTLQKYIEVFGLEIIESDEYPALICQECQKSLDDAAKLRQVVLLADSFFRKIFEDMKASEEEPDDKCDVEEEYLLEVIEIDDEEVIETPTEELNIVTQQQETSNVTRSLVENCNEKTYKKKIIQCHCGIIFSSSQRLKNHKKVKHDSINEADMFACSLCSKKFKLREYLELHVKNVHSESDRKKLNQKRPCSMCGKVLSSLMALKNHKERHSIANQPEADVKKFCCDICGSIFRLKSYLFNHINNKHIRQKYPCEHCEKSFYKKYECEDHVRQYHTFERPFVCEFEGCSKSFSRKKNYNIHKRIHTGERPYACLFEGCEKSFIHFIDRKRHMMKHTGEKPFACNVEGCQKLFRRKTELDSHTKAAHSVVVI